MLTTASVLRIFRQNKSNNIDSKFQLDLNERIKIQSKLNKNDLNSSKIYFYHLNIELYLDFHLIE